MHRANTSGPALGYAAKESPRGEVIHEKEGLHTRDDAISVVHGVLVNHPN